MRCVTPEADGKRWVNEGKTRKEIKRKLQLFALAQTSWQNIGKGSRDSVGIVDLFAAQKWNPSKQQTLTMFVSFIPIPERFYQIFEMDGKNLPD